MGLIVVGMSLAADSTTTAAWFALGGVLRTGLFALATTLLTHRLQLQNAERSLRQEQPKQLRQERREAYVQYWSSWNRFIHALRDLSGELRQQGMRPTHEASWPGPRRGSPIGPGRPSATGGRQPTRCC
jgi:hypothetical protein